MKVVKAKIRCELRNIWVISDTHFGHENILNFKQQDGSMVRNFSSVDKMNETMIDNWNSVVKQGDKVYHLGDVFFGSKDDFKKLWPRLNGSKRLIVGNHDDIKFLSSGGFFQKVAMWRVFSDLGLILTHTPQHQSALTGKRNGLLNIHGHIHANKSPDGPYKCVCVEQINYTPVNIDELRG
jgi:calcineurin-like phosphoesterase family protein